MAEKYLAIFILFLMPAAFAHKGVMIEVGAANASYEWSDAHYVRISQRFGDDKFAVGVAHTGKQNLNTCGYPACEINVWRNLYIDVTRYFRWKCAEIGVGPAIIANANRITPANLNIHVSLQCRYKRITFGVHHYSNAGTSPTDFNMGQDAVTIGWRF